MAAIIAGKPLEMYQCDKPTGKMMEAKFLFDELGAIDKGLSRNDRLKRVAELATSSGNGRLARTIVNRLWARLMGRGLVEPVDMMSNRPWSEDMLDYLAWDLAQNGYDLKRTLSIIVSSRIYQSATVVSSKSGEDFVFEGPSVKRMTAEQFIDAVWGITGTAPGKIDAEVKRASKTSTQSVPGKWIWSAPGSRPAGEKVIFKKSLNLPSKTTGKIIITCDNAYVLLVNGKKVGGDADWETVERFDVNRYLAKGKNEFQVMARNLGSDPNDAGLYLLMNLTDLSGTQTTVISDRTWLANGQNAVEQASPSWGARVNDQIRTLFNDGDIRDNDEVRSVRASLVKATLLMRALGRPNREQVVTTRPDDLTTLQALELNNGEEFVNYLNRGAAKFVTQEEMVETLYLEALSRRPSSLEKQVAREILGTKITPESTADLLWTILMLPEFQFIN